MGGFIVAVIVGGLIGWIASKIMRTDAEQGIFLNIVVGCIGSMIGKFIAGQVFGLAGTGLRDGLDIPSLAVALAGAIVLLGIVNLIRKGKVR
ncbi:GlsB/YeaQ/YmgE family stress response membrane protein [Sphingomonas lacunae]|uniref:GlsB/YeaQ/YmgE family stress response membrane protein n=1 Tax=Sphingomonas lacunae TaxID=2698828 RepID=A0A6M4AS04_9SPHN|nr:GlsB/YeaQ/YmgE family stress response membrane protein [Sphingomonas lacunae]QJQ31486.1 GlsB/YeaQ/YmgE family stress response membrane protein [Sphingomonas lacunae]